MQITEAQLDALAMDAMERFEDAERMRGTNGGLYRFEGFDVYWSRKKHGIIKLHVQGQDYELPVG